MDRQTRPNKKLSEKRILEAAEKVFAEKGYDGARVDEIAQKAGVNKALLYYYFKSKDALFRETLRQSLVDGFNLRDNMYAKPFSSSPADLGKRLQKAFSFVEEKKDIFRVLVMEAIKGGTDKTELFEMVEQLIFQRIHSSSLKAQAQQWPRNRRHLFYFVIVPFLAFITLNDSWSEYFQDDPQQGKKECMTALQEIMTHLIDPNSDQPISQSEHTMNPDLDHSSHKRS